MHMGLPTTSVSHSSHQALPSPIKLWNVSEITISHAGLNATTLIPALSISPSPLTLSPPLQSLGGASPPPEAHKTTPKLLAWLWGYHCQTGMIPQPPCRSNPAITKKVPGYSCDNEERLVPEPAEMVHTSENRALLCPHHSLGCQPLQVKKCVLLPFVTFVFCRELMIWDKYETGSMISQN